MHSWKFIVFCMQSVVALFMGACSTVFVVPMDVLEVSRFDAGLKVAWLIYFDLEKIVCIIYIYQIAA